MANDSASPVKQFNVVNQIENEPAGHGLSKIANKRHQRLRLHGVSVIGVRLV